MALRGTSRAEVLVASFEAAGQFLRVTSSDRPILLSNETYVPDPALSAQVPERTGLMEEDACTIKTSALYGFVTDVLLSSGTGQVNVILTKLVIEPGEATKIVFLYNGVASTGEINASGEQGLVTWTVLDTKRQADASIQMVVLDTCENKGLGKRFCGFNVVEATETGTLTAANYDQVTVTGLPARVGGWWQDGIIRANGIERKVRRWDGSETFYLSQPAPRDWIDSVSFGGTLACEVEPGCNLLPNNCLEFEQQANNLGLGLNMPNYHPSFERPDS